MARIKDIGELRKFLDSKSDQYNSPSFILLDPISIPHQFSKKQDREVAGLFASTLAWGQRVTIIKNCQDLLARMDNAPHQFVLHHKESDLKRLEHFVHRTFNSADLLYFIHFLKSHYLNSDSLEDLFVVDSSDVSIEKGLVCFEKKFSSLYEFPSRTRKHVATPSRKSACKRLNMFLRWMVRRDNHGVDFGIWRRIKPSQLVCPIDVHVERTARKLHLIGKQPLNWQTALDLTAQLRKFDEEDPVKYDFALFGLGLEGRKVKV